LGLPFCHLLDLH